MKLVSLIPLLLLSFNVEADVLRSIPSESQLPCVQAANALLDELRMRRIGTVGTLDIDAFVSRMAELKWRNGDTLFRPSEAGERRSAYFSVAAREVTLLSDLSESSEAAMRILCLHEALGASGISDGDYQRSLAIYSLSTVKTEDMPKYKSWLDRVLIAGGERGGSATGVSGGGDIHAIAFKLAVLEEIRKAPTYNGFLSDFLSTPFEPNYTSEIELRVIHLKHNHIEFRVPMQVWLYGSAGDRKNLVFGALSVLRSLSVQNETYPSIIIARCGEVQFTLPAHADPKVTAARTEYIRSTQQFVLTKIKDVTKQPCEVFRQ